MRGIVRVLALCSFAALAAVVPALSAAGRTAVPLFTMTINGTDRDGTPVAVAATVYGTNGVNYLLGGSSVQVPAGTYEVGAAIWRPADGDSQTIVAQTVHVSGSTAVTLNAQGAVPVSVSLNVPGLTQGNQTVSVCVKGGGAVNSLAGFLVDSAGTVYVKPMTASNLRTVYQTYYQATGKVYDVAGAFAGGIPASPVYHQKLAAMAKVNVQLRDYENVTPLQSFFTEYYGCGSLTEPETLLPAVYTNYRTAGTWTDNENLGPTPNKIQKDLFTTRTYLAGHTYAENFNNAVTGPGAVFPQIQGSNVVYSPNGLIEDPFVGTSDCEGKATVTLHRLTTLVKSQNLKFCGNTFAAHVAKAGWVTLAANAVRWNPSGALPAGFLLSTRVSVTWHFQYAPLPGGPTSTEPAPVRVTRFQPQGLSWYNDAQGGSTTPVRIYVLNGGGTQYRLRTIKIQVSFNDGKTWLTLGAVAHPGYWLASIKNPAKTGYVSLRSIVTDAHGDSSTESIIRAYLVENAG